MFILGEPQQTPYDLRFPFLGFPIRVSPFFWVAAAILGALSFEGWVSGEPDDPNIVVMVVIWVAVMFASILVHELGHAFAMRYYGENARIVLYHFGGLAIQDTNAWSFGGSTSGRSHAQQIIISAAGPAAGFIFAALVASIVIASGGWFHAEYFREFLNPSYVEFNRGQYIGDTIAERPRLVYLLVLLQSAMYINIFWGLINLLPVYPLDGGQISRELYIKFGGPAGQRNSLWLSVIAGGVVAVLGLINGHLMIGILFGSLAFSSWQMIQQLDGRGGGFGGGPW